jgi:two-component system sensor histidine kinase QseC
MSGVWSLRNRLIALIALAALLVWALSGAWLYRGVLIESERMFDAALIETAHSVLAVVAHEVGDDGEDGVEVELEAIDHAHRESLYFHVRDARNRVLFRSPGSPHERLGDRNATGLTQRRVDATDFRVYTLAFPARKLRIDVAQPLSERARVSRATAVRLLLPGLVLALVLALGVYAIVRQVIAPIVRYSEAIDQHAPGAASTLAGDTLPQELRPVTAAIDGLLRRVDAALLHERTLTADAAHELRTPLAAMRAQAQVALRAHDEQQRRDALQALIDGVDRAARVVDSVLTLARLDARELDRAASPSVDLVALTQAVTAEFGGRIERGGLSLTLRLQPVHARVDADAIAVLLRNLLDNALRHARARIDVGLAGEHGRAIWQVRDDGPGMSDDQRRRAFDRFYRAGGDGAGLGLAMVQRIAGLHGGEVKLIDGLDGHGLGVEAVITD